MPSRKRQPVLVSTANPRVKAWARLSERKYREREGRFRLEGVHLVQEALDAGWPLEVIVYDADRGIPDELAAHADRAAAGGGVEPEWIPASYEVIAKCSDTETPQPVFAVARRRPVSPDAFFGASGGPVVVLDAVQDPGNVGTIIRSAAASGAAAVVLGRGTADLYNAKTIRATMGALFRIPAAEADLAEWLPEARRRGARLIGASLGASVSCYDVDWTGPVWLALGNEGAGLSPGVSALLDERVIIPMTGRAESLNVAMAATVLLFEAQRQRLARAK
mgnify:FL=1|jgi:TrmH family RNA methyltransferase